MNCRLLAVRFSPVATIILFSGWLAAADPPKSPALDYNVHMSDCENRWVALYHKPGDNDYTYGFVYIDPQD